MNNKSKNMKILPSFLIALSFSLAGLSVKGQCEATIATDRLSNTKFDTECVAAHINNFFSVDEVVDYMVGTLHDQIYLLTQAIEPGNGTWIYLIPLEINDGRLAIKETEVLNACESSILNIETFSFENGQFRGCTRNNHKVGSIR